MAKFLTLAFVVAFISSISTSPRHLGVNGQNILKDHILKGGQYDPMVPPGNFAENVRMQIHFDVLQLVEVVESEQFIKVRLWTSLYWWDSRLRWDPEETNGVKYVYLPRDAVWTPYLFVDNSAALQYTKPWAAAEVNISYIGRVAMKGYMVLITNCPMRVRSYPFDKQACPIMISSSDDMFQVGGELPTANFTVYTMEHSEFKVYGLKVQRGLPSLGQMSDIGFDPGVVTVTLTLFISRNSLQHVIALIVPCTLICILGITGLFVQMDPRGERIERYRFGLTAVLSLVIFQLGLYERLPISNDGIPVLSIYYNMLFAMICFGTMATSIPLMFHAKGIRNEPFPKQLEWVISFMGRPDIYRDEDDDKKPLLATATAAEPIESSNNKFTQQVDDVFGYNTSVADQQLQAQQTQSGQLMLGSNLEATKACWCTEPNGDLSYLMGGAHDYLNLLADTGAHHHHPQQQTADQVNALLFDTETHQAFPPPPPPMYMSNNTRAIISQPQAAAKPFKRKRNIQWIEFALKLDAFLLYFFFTLLIVTNAVAFWVWLSVELPVDDVSE